MFKLLTEEEREKVMREYATRRTVVILYGIMLVLVAAVVGLMPPYVLSNAREKEALERLRVLERSGVNKSDLDAQAWLNDINHKLTLVAPALDIDKPSRVVEQILAEKIPGIRIIHISWAKIGNTVTISINGVAKDRQTLITFRDRIIDRGFSDVTLPISNLAQNKDIDFQIKFAPATIDQT